MNAIQNIIIAGGVFMAFAVTAQTSTPEPRSVKGRTVDSEGRPVAGVVVQHYDYRQAQATRFEFDAREQATSGADGNFELRISGASALPQAPSLLIARKTGLAAAWMQFVAANPAEPHLVLTPPSFMAGTVVDEADKPVAGAEVSVVMAFISTSIGGNRSFAYLNDKPARDLFTAKTGADGRFRLEGFPTNASAALLAQAPGKAMRSTGIENFSPDAMPCRAGQDDIRLVLEAAGTIEGKIVSGEAGETAPAAQLSVLPNGPGSFALGSRPPDKSKPDGTFRLDSLPAGSYRIQASFGTNAVPDWVAETALVTVESGQPARDVQLTAIRGGVLEVAVRGKDGKPVEDAGINVYKDGYQTGLTSRSNGVAILRLPPGDYQVSAYKQGWQQANVSASVEARKTNQVELELTPPRKLAGIAHLPNGQPATNLAVQVVGDYSMQQSNLRTGPDGKFEMDWNGRNFDGNNMTPCLLIRDPERNLAVAQDLDADSEKLDVRLAPAVSFAARVVQADAKPITNATAALVFWTGNSGMHLNDVGALTNTPGQIEMVALPPGRRYGLQISAPGYGSKYIDLTQSAEEAKRVELDPVELRRADRKLAGKLVDNNDKPVAGAMVQVNGDGQPNANVQTDREGRFSFDVCEGSVRLFANSQRNFANISAEAGDTNVIMKLGEQSMNYGGAKPQTLKGNVTDASGKPVTGAEVRVFPMEMPSRNQTDTNGAFSVKYIVQPWQRQNGNPWIVVRDRAHNLAAAQELLEENATNVTVQLEPGLTVKGHVFDPDAKPLPNAQVHLMLQAGRMGGSIDDQPLATDAEGSFTFTALPVAQDYSLYVSRAGYSQKNQKIQADWDTNVVEVPPVVLRIPNQLIAGRVIDAKDKPVSGVHVQVSSDDQPQISMQTDSKGRFKFKVCEGQVHMYASGQVGFAQVTAEAGDTNVTILLTDRSMRSQSTVRRPASRTRPNVSALQGKPLPDLAALGFAADAAPAGKPVLLCLLDVQQRPSRRLARLLTDAQDALREKGVTILAAQTVAASDEAWKDWNEVNLGHLTITRVTEKSDKTKWASGLENLPWLILADKNGQVVAEGFSFEELEAKLKEAAR